MNPRHAIDLGSGPGCLSSAIAERWKKCQIITVDIDAYVQTEIAGGRGRHNHYILDALDPELPYHLLDSHHKVDLAVSNPPYGSVAKFKGAAEILSAAGLPKIRNLSAECGAEIVFLGQSLRLIRDGGQAGLIVPDGLITGRAMCDLRMALATQHTIDAVVQLPRRSFLRTEAQAFILMLSKIPGGRRPIVLKKYDADGTIFPPIYLNPREAFRRLDYDFHAQQGLFEQSIRLGDLGVEIVRGILNSAQRTDGAFHTSDFPEKPGRIFLPGSKGEDSVSKHSAKTGDILLARIHRNLERKVCLVAGGTAVLTDCVYRIRAPLKLRGRLFKFLRSPAGQLALASVARGTGARMISKSELLNLQIPLLS
ncbi:N-6 DNA methylase [Methylovirgula sp. HY1]|uniref:N-6 DNA methylase n=1 Tax=Methylovirgula sp. HY1 TaxID=2822761 RepID=UPI001C5A73DF